MSGKMLLIYLILAVPGLIFPSADDSVRIYAYSDGFHTFIVLPDTCRTCPDSFVEYEYAEKAWYLDGRNQWYRAFPVLFTHTEGTVGENRQEDHDFPVSPENQFSFLVSRENYGRMREFIESWIDRNTVLLRSENQIYYRSTRPYNLFNSCHAFVLKSLKAGGVDVNPRWGLFNRLTVWRLKKAEEERLKR
jgi:hypothetical protein